MTPSTRLAALVFAISLLPCPPAAEAGSPPSDFELRLQSTFERTIGAVVALAVDNQLKQTVEAQMGVLRARELFRLAGLTRGRGAAPAASPAASATAKASPATNSENSASRSSAEPQSDTVCTFSPPSTLLCVLRAESRSLDTGEP